MLLCGQSHSSADTSEALRHETSIIISQLADGEGELDYEIRIGGPSRYVVPVESVALTAPDGTLVGWQVERGRSYSTVSAESFDELETRFFGEWSVAETLVGGEQVHYEFTLNTFELVEVFSEVPTILSPTPGATVPLEFTVTWAYEDGTIPMLSTIGRTDLLQGVRSFNTVSTSPTSWNVEVEPTGEFDLIDVTLSAGNSMRMENGVSFVPPIDRINDEFYFGTFFRTLSSPVAFVVAVPEPPSGLFMASFLVLAIASGGRVRSGT